MILSRSPLRITLGGGSTDLASFYTKFGGFMITAGINRYCTILADERFESAIRLAYSETENIDKVSDIRHPIFRESLRFIGIENRIEVHSIAYLPSNSGLGSSSSFTVALLNALHTYKREYVSQKELAEQAAHIEIDVLKSPIGKQDHYASAISGLTCLTFEKDGNVIVEPLKVSNETLEQLETNLQFYYTGLSHDTNEILKEQDIKSKEDDPKMLDNLMRIKEIGLATRKALEDGVVDEFGYLLREHWMLKKQRTDKMTSPFIDGCYQEALKNGALGGKLIGSGGGGFLMFYCQNGSGIRLLQAMNKMGLRYEKFKFDFDGAKIIFNG
jgi:D-glycero-alpha-D-manno-heptose-7-phosphate kinase